jgi:hypothetical protein
VENSVQTKSGSNYKVHMPHKDQESHQRTRGKDKERERRERNGKYSSKHIRYIDSVKKEKKNNITQK